MRASSNNSSSFKNSKLTKCASTLLIFLLAVSTAPVSFADSAPAEPAAKQTAPAPVVVQIPTKSSSPVVEQTGGDKWIPWVQTGGKLGDDRAISTSEALVPLYQTPDSLWFADAHFKDIDGPAWEGNLGGG